MSTAWKTLLATMTRTIAKHNLLQPRQSIVVAVSGGADSMALLHGLHALGYTLNIVHIDHNTRDGASTADAAFVEKEAQALGVPYHIETWNGAGTETGDSFEMAARQYRYQCYSQIAQQTNAELIATGHHADDQIETLLMRILRGTSLQGLTGIPYQRMAEERPVVRPLLDCSHESIIEALKVKGISWREDESNSDSAYQRNKIRNELLPYLRENYNSNVDHALLRMSDTLRDDAALLEKQASEAAVQCTNTANALQREKFNALHPALQRRVALQWAWQKGANPDKTRIDDLIEYIAHGKTGSRFDLGEKVQLIVDAKWVQPYKKQTDGKKDTVLLHLDSITTFQNQDYTVAMQTHDPKQNLKDQCTPTRQVFDADKIEGSLRLRNRMLSDTFTPLGMTGTRKLKDVLIDKHIPVQDRNELPLLCDSSHVLWIVGQQPAAHAAVDDNTTTLLVVEVQHETE